MTVKIPTVKFFESGQRLMSEAMDRSLTVQATIASNFYPADQIEERKKHVVRNLAINFGKEMLRHNHAAVTIAPDEKGDIGIALTAHTIPEEYMGDRLQYAVDYLYWQSYQMKDEAGGAQVRRLVDMIIQELSQDEEIKDATERPVVTPA